MQDTNRDKDRRKRSLARIGGINLPVNKHICISLTTIYGIGRHISKLICDECDIRYDTKTKDLNQQQLDKIRNALAKYTIEGDLRREVSTDIKRLTDLSCYRGLRHKKRLPVRGQRTKNNARTRKGPLKVKGKK